MRHEKRNGCYVTGVEAGDVEDEDGIEEVVVGDWVVVNYDAKMYPGKVTKVVEGSMKVNVMKACFPNGWKWPNTSDEIFYKNESVVKKINPPTPLNSRGVWQFPDSVLKDFLFVLCMLMSDALNLC